MPNAKVTVVATYDNSLIFYSGGKTFSIDTNSPVVGTKTLPLVPPIKGAAGYVPSYDFLVVKTKTWDDLYLAMTIDQYNVLVAATQASAGAPEITLAYTVGTDIPTTSPAVVTTTGLSNFHINALFVGGLAQDVRLITYTPGTPTGTADLSAILGGGLSAGLIVMFVGYNP